VLATYSQDGYYYEGFEYWIFSTPWLVHYLDAHAHATGEDLYDRPGFRMMHQYVAHSMLPTGNYVFDFGDIFEGPLTRAGKGEEYPRTHPQGHFNTNYNLIYRMAQRFQSGEAQGVAAWLKGFNQVNAEDFWSLVWYDANLRPVPIEQQPAWHYFADHDVFYWRSNWSRDATAFAFKCGPPEGHHTEALLRQFPDWRLSSGHAHPDANSFIIFADGQYLTGDSGYAGVPLTEHHNTLLIDGKGQGKEGDGHDAFAEVSYELLNRIRIVDVKVEPGQVIVRGDATAAYLPEVGLKKFVREFVYRPGAGFSVTDDVETNRPALLTWLLHADDKIEKGRDNRFIISAGAIKLLIDPSIEGSKNFKSSIAPNDVTAPGPPGAVDKGERQVRGQKLLMSPPEPVSKARFIQRLKVQK
jgi:heparinase II/III-like protein